MLTPLGAAHDARASEVEALIDGPTKRVVSLDAGVELTVEELRHYPACAPTSETLLADRATRALDAFFAKKEARAHRERNVHVSIGCAEPSGLLVSLHLPIGIGESVQATYLVDERRSKLVADGHALADADLDADNQRDLVWLTPDRHVAVRFTGGAKALVTPLTVPECEDTDCSFVGVPALASAFAVVLAHHAASGSIRIDQRQRWNGTQFVAVDRLDDDAFEGRYESARDRELAVLDDAMFGGFGKLRVELDRCASAPAVDAACTAVFEKGVGMMTKGGVTEANARSALRAYLGWQRCSAAPER